MHDIDMEGMEMLERLCAVDGEGSMGPEEGGGGVNVLRERETIVSSSYLSQGRIRHYRYQ